VSPYPLVGELPSLFLDILGKIIKKLCGTNSFS
jgi:hypothetical protein